MLALALTANSMSKVHPRLQTPVNATLLCAIISAVLSLIYVGNTTAFFAIANGASIFSLLCYSESSSANLLHSTRSNSSLLSTADSTSNCSGKG
jgi:amino acid transporter